MNNNIKDFSNTFNIYFPIYLLTLLFFGIFYLFIKHNVGNDSSMSEYLINYQGGFVRRGLIGELAFNIGKLLNTNIRFIIFIFQSFIYTLYLLLIFNLFKRVKINTIILFAIFTPIFLLYPIAELESLGRKETVMYVFFLTLLNIQSYRNANLFVLFVMPIACLVYEEIILFSGFIYAVLIIKNKIFNFKKFFYLSYLFIPSFIIVSLFFIYPISVENHKIMADELLRVFGESCYMSCSMLVTNDINNITTMIKTIWSHDISIALILIRYLLIFVIGFFPIMILSYYSEFKYVNFFNKLKINKIILLFFIFYLPTLPLFLFGGDWGRWIGMIITFTTIFYFYLFKENIIVIDHSSINKKLIFFKNKKKLATLLFIIFSFGWNQKTTSVEDIATNPLYKIPYNTSKIIFGFNSIKLFQDNFIIKLHKKYIE